MLSSYVPYLVLLLICLLGLQAVSFFQWKKRTQEAKKAHLASLHLMQSQEEELAKVRKEREKFREMYLLHLDKNQEFEKQRTAIWELYRLSGLQAGNAQALLLGELQLAITLLNSYKVKAGEKPVQLRSELKQLVEDFSKEHGKERPAELVVS